MGTRKAVVLDLAIVQAISGYLQEQPFKHVAPLLGAIEQGTVIDVPEGGFPSLNAPSPQIPLASAARTNGNRIDKASKAAAATAE